MYTIEVSVITCTVGVEHNEKDADVHFARMRCGWKSFSKANGRLLKDGHKTGG